MRNPHVLTAPCTSHRFLLSGPKGVTAELVISGPAGPEEIALLQRYVATLEIAVGGCNCGPDDAPLNPGDVVQVRPSADRTFGGLMLRVCKSSDFEVRGYLLVPHRGGHKAAWLPWKPCELTRIGAVRWPEAEWGFRPADAQARRLMWSDK